MGTFVFSSIHTNKIGIALPICETTKNTCDFPNVWRVWKTLSQTLNFYDVVVFLRARISFDELSISFGVGVVHESTTATHAWCEAHCQKHTPEKLDVFALNGSVSVLYLYCTGFMTLYGRRKCFLNFYDVVVFLRARISFDELSISFGVGVVDESTTATHTWCGLTAKTPPEKLPIICVRISAACLSYLYCIGFMTLYGTRPRPGLLLVRDIFGSFWNVKNSPRVLFS
jgi:hypothetical protein